jgi:single-strand DNA-binding protein
MAGVNKAIILGRLGRDPEMTYTQAGLAVCKFSIATSRKMKEGQEVTQWHRCTAFGKAGELISRYVNKGHMLYVEGEITYSQYEKDGITRYSTDIIVREFNFVGSGNAPQGGVQNNQQGNEYQGGGGYQGGQGGQGGGGYQGGGQGGGYQPPQPPQGGGGDPAGGGGGYQGGAGPGASPADPGMTGGSPPDDDIPF